MNADSSPSKLPKLYLDWDGVVNFFGSRSKYNRHAGFGSMRRGSVPSPAVNGDPSTAEILSMNWSADLLRKLAALPVEIVILSTWRHRFPELLKATSWDLADYRILDWTDGPDGSIHAGKIDALLADHLADPRPFIWADDEAHSFLTDAHRNLFSTTPHLLLAPDDDLGLTADDLSSMVSFLAGLS